MQMAEFVAEFCRILLKILGIVEISEFVASILPLKALKGSKRPLFQ
jgi:hypothetical protein